MGVDPGMPVCPQCRGQDAECPECGGKVDIGFYCGNHCERDYVVCTQCGHHMEDQLV